MTREIPMGGRKSRGRVALVDDQDYEEIARYRWNAALGYATRTDQTLGIVYMHRQILCLSRGDERVIHHINEDRLDNRRANLVVCASRSEANCLPHPKRDAAISRAARAVDRWWLRHREVEA